MKFLFNFIKTKEIKITPRVFPNNYFLNDVYHQQICTKGYVVLKKVVNEDFITQLNQTYEKLTQFEAYTIDKKFQNSGRFQSTEIRNFVMDNIGAFSKSFLPTIFNCTIFDEDTTGAFQIKPPSKVSELNPHQDAPVIDETKENGLFVWIPLCDIDEQNGAIMILQGSHLWNNYQRSLNVPWIFEKHTKLLWKQMIPLFVNKGDIIVWDTALIHASLPNLSNNTRVAITSTLLPKKFKMVEYFKDKQTPKNKIEKYQVEKSFWETADIMKRPPCPPNEFIELEEQVFPNYISAKQLLSLIDKFKENHVSV